MLVLLTGEYGGPLRTLTKVCFAFLSACVCVCGCFLFASLEQVKPDNKANRKPAECTLT